MHTAPESLNPTATAPATQAPAPARLRCDRALEVSTLPARARAELGPALYDIFCDNYGALDYDTVADEIIFRAGGQLYLIRDANGALVGFGTLALDPVTVDGRACFVLQAGVYMRRGVRGGGAVFVRRGCARLVRARLRHPLRPIYAVFELLTPIPYRLAARVFPQLYPSRRGPTPPRMERLLHHTIDRRGLRRAGAHPFVIQYPDPASHHAPERITGSPSKRADPDVQFYLAQNPRFPEGQLLCAIAPLNLPQLVIAIARCVRLILNRRRA